MAVFLTARFFERVIKEKLSRCLSKIAKSFVLYLSEIIREKFRLILLFTTNSSKLHDYFRSRPRNVRADAALSVTMGAATLPESPPPPQALRIYISVWITLDYQYGRHERRTRGNRASDSWREREKDGEKRRKRMDRGREMVEMAVLVGWSTTTTGGGVVEVDACGHCDPSERVNRKHKFNRFHPLLRALWRHRISH